MRVARALTPIDPAAAAQKYQQLLAAAVARQDYQSASVIAQ